MRNAASPIILTTMLLGCASSATPPMQAEFASHAVTVVEHSTADVQETRVKGTFHHVMRSNEIGQDFSIDVALPAAAADGGPYPVIYLTDGNLMFPMVNSTMRLLEIGEEMPPAILVGIGYVDSTQSLTLRVRDLTPTLNSNDSSDSENATAESPLIKSGGADNFLDFIANNVKPFIEKNYPASTSDTTLMGDSLGGLFTLHALLTRAQEYTRYISGSPSIWWDNAVLFETEKKYARDHTDLDARVFISVGGLEQPDSEESANFNMVTNMHDMAKRLANRNYPSLDVTVYEFEGETHLSVIPATFSRGLREVFKN